jgi:carotenoid cleavage dioxygenase
VDVEIVSKFFFILPEDDDHPYRTGPGRPQTTEWNGDDLTAVAGEIPRDLDGVYLRNTENPLHPALQTYHPFDGDGMLHVVGFRDGKSVLSQPFYPHRRLFSRKRRGRTAVDGVSVSGAAGTGQTD